MRTYSVPELRNSAPEPDWAAASAGRQISNARRAGFMKKSVNDRNGSFEFRGPDFEFQVPSAEESQKQVLRLGRALFGASSLRMTTSEISDFAVPLCLGGEINRRDSRGDGICAIARRWR